MYRFSMLIINSWATYYFFRVIRASRLVQLLRQIFARGEKRSSPGTTRRSVPKYRSARKLRLFGDALSDAFKVGPLLLT